MKTEAKKRKRINKCIYRTAQQKEWENVVVVRAVQYFNKNKKQATLRNLWSYFSAFNEDKEDSVACLWHMSTDVFSIETLRARLQEIERIGWVSSETSNINGCKHYFAANLEFGAYGDGNCPQSKWYTQSTEEENELGIQCGIDYIPERPVGFVYLSLENFDDEIEKKQNVSFTGKNNILTEPGSKIEFSNNAEQEKIEIIKRLREVGSRSIDVIEYDIQCLKAKANRINLNGEYFYPESLQALYEEAIDELKLWLDHANSMFKYHDDREEIYHKLHQAIIDGLRQFDSDCKEMEDRDAR